MMASVHHHTSAQVYFNTCPPKLLLRLETARDIKSKGFSELPSPELSPPEPPNTQQGGRRGEKEGEGEKEERRGLLPAASDPGWKRERAKLDYATHKRAHSTFTNKTTCLIL